SLNFYPALLEIGNTRDGLSLAFVSAGQVRCQLIAKLLDERIDLRRISLEPRHSVLYYSDVVLIDGNPCLVTADFIIESFHLIDGFAAGFLITPGVGLRNHG